MTGRKAADRAERKARAYAAVEALLNRENDAWACYQRSQRVIKLRKELPKRIERARAKLAELEAQARDIGVQA